ncbi:Inosine-uridine nucleoside N-ribohydrolase [Caldibacillus debilis GB1]|jgi:purine nucleosidase|uniref:Inosine-uridine nucleoside N-ribohydrolase n=2 Tax=Caldibacillus debilis TaxID=301148 RepID=A0A420VFL5_9BACI|nr:Inosine-uridine nucleoside N-ribohydrolase [Caldibacillus debilis GB1]
MPWQNREETERSLRRKCHADRDVPLQWDPFKPEQKHLRVNRMKKVIMDVDTGIDDALALVYALRSPELEVLGITTCFGNHTVEQTTKNTLKVLELLNRTDIPVAKGAREPVFRRNDKGPSSFHGSDGLACAPLPEPKAEPADEHAADFIVRMVRTYPHEVTLIPVGPLTNLALAVMKDPSIARLVKNVTLMGGAVFHPGNYTPVAEANIYADPEAAELVFRSGMPVTMVGLDVTMKTLLPRSVLEEWRKIGTPLGRFLTHITEFYMDAYLKFYPSIGGCALHDPLAVGAVIDPSFVKTERLYVQVDTEGEISKGRTVADLRPSHPEPNVDVCTEVDAERFLRHFLDRMNRPGS